MIEVLNDPDKRMTRLVERLRMSRSPHFVLCLGSTETSDVEGISAAGASPAHRRQTPRLDAEALVLGHTATGDSIPVSPLGVVSPVVITRPCLAAAGCSITIVDCGTFEAPGTDTITVGRAPARCLSTGAAMERPEVEELFRAGKQLARGLAREHDLIVVAECVPGGTTTAMAALVASGFHVDGCLSSSVPQSEHGIRERLVQEGIGRAGLAETIVTGKPRETAERQDGALSITAALGDPMQPFAAGIALGAVAPVVLAGGSQMLAVYALARRLQDESARSGDRGALEVGVLTTGWVAYDRSAKTIALSAIVDAPFACARLNLSGSAHAGLRAYEEGHVKEGVGAGASMAMASALAALDERSMVSLIDSAYTSMTTISRRETSRR